ncbi:MAG: hypothetical protein FJW40_26315 [Acidobacteria bacterium]|nr:hypothetical protein [Acidobacteriota bacterium]
MGRTFLQAAARLLSLAVINQYAVGREIRSLCGNHPELWREVLATHQRGETRRLTTAAARFSARPPADRDIGHIAIIEDSGGVAVLRNEFTLSGRSITFRPEAAGNTAYRFEVASGGYDAAGESGGPVTLEDDDAISYELSFPFTYFGKTHRSLFIHSDGNVTFERPDADTSDRSLGRLTAGPARIAPAFRDLDPSRAGSVRVLSEPSRILITWLDVPEYQEFGLGPRQTVQLELDESGRIRLSLHRVSSRVLVVGISPGGLQGSTSVVNFAAGSAETYRGSVAERFGASNEVDIVRVAQRFYETHSDSYDYLVIYNSLGIAAGPGAVAFEVTVRNNRSGYGDVASESGAIYGSASRLQAVLNMGPLGQYPTDPAGVVPARTIAGDTPLTVLGHEAGHLFLAYASVRDTNDPRARPMLGRQTAHWNFAFNSEASLLEGNRIRDNGAAASPRFTTTAAVQGFSPLDQYLMGLRAPGEVPPTFLVPDPSIGNFNRGPQVGLSFDGDRRDIRVEELIEVEGRRTPDHTVAQRRFRFAFILVTAEGVPPADDVLRQIETYRKEFEPAFRKYTDERAEAVTALQTDIALASFPATGAIQGRTFRSFVTIPRPAPAPLTVLLRARDGLLEPPRAVTIPAGAVRADFEVRALRPGADTLTAEPADTRFGAAQARIHVAQPAELRAVIVYGDHQRATPGVPLDRHIVVRLTDINGLPYPGVTLDAELRDGGRLGDSVAMTDEYGQARFRWIPGPSGTREMRITLPGTPVAATARAE